MTSTPLALDKRRETAIWDAGRGWRSVTSFRGPCDVPISPFGAGLSRPLPATVAVAVPSWLKAPRPSHTWLSRVPATRFAADGRGSRLKRTGKQQPRPAPGSVSTEMVAIETRSLHA
ncbi:hypothetical protein CDD83_7383 [Cordyceps sp. RAO-2017]|nr:hypothetical protein CDD83_7383 [Cordyceps sp. RAO-2017]